MSGLLQVCNNLRTLLRLILCMGEQPHDMLQVTKRGSSLVNMPHKARSRKAVLIQNKRGLRHGQQRMNSLILLIPLHA